MTIHKRKRLHSSLKCFSYVIHILWNHGCVHQIYFLNPISRHNILPGNVEANVDFIPKIYGKNYLEYLCTTKVIISLFYIIRLVEDVTEINDTGYKKNTWKSQQSLT